MPTWKLAAFIFGGILASVLGIWVLILAYRHAANGDLNYGYDHRGQLVVGNRPFAAAFLLLMTAAVCFGNAIPAIRKRNRRDDDERR